MPRVRDIAEAASGGSLLRIGNPLREEAAALRVVLLVLGALLLVALAARLSTWLGVAVFLAEVAAVTVLLVQARRHRVAAAAAAQERPRGQVDDTPGARDGRGGTGRG